MLCDVPAPVATRGISSSDPPLALVIRKELACRPLLLGAKFTPRLISCPGARLTAPAPEKLKSPPEADIPPILTSRFPVFRSDNSLRLEFPTATSSKLRLASLEVNSPCVTLDDARTWTTMGASLRLVKI